MLAVPLATLAPSAAAGHLDLDQVHEEATDGSAAFGIRTVTESDGPIRFTLDGEAPTRSTPLSGGVVLFDEHGEPGLVIAITLHRSPDRVVVEPTPANPAPASSAGQLGEWVTRARGDISMLDTHDVAFHARSTDAREAGASEGVVFSASVTKLGAEAGTHNVGLWVGQVGSSTLKIATDEPVGEVATSEGQAHVAGDPDLDTAKANVQVQQEPVDPSLIVGGLDAPLGFKAMVDASVTIDTEKAAYGFWGLHEFRYACTLGTACASLSLAELPCPDPIPVACTTASLSWQGPGTGASGERLFSFRQVPPGTYTFTVDHKVDIYGPRWVDDDTGTRVAWYEHHSYLTIGEIALPSP